MVNVWYLDRRRGDTSQLSELEKIISIFTPDRRERETGLLDVTASLAPHTYTLLSRLAGVLCILYQHTSNIYKFHYMNKKIFLIICYLFSVHTIFNFWQVKCINHFLWNVTNTVIKFKFQNWVTICDMFRWKSLCLLYHKLLLFYQSSVQSFVYIECVFPPITVMPHNSHILQILCNCIKRREAEAMQFGYIFTLDYHYALNIH